jgi:hypothetical protein
MTKPLSAAKLGNRHLGSLGSRFTEINHETGTVVIAAQTDFASSYAGQHLLFMLTNLLARQYDVVKEIKIGVPDVKTLDEAIILGSKEPKLPAALAKVASAVSTGTMTVTMMPCLEVEAGVQLSFGPNSIAGFADGWRLFVGQIDKIPKAASESVLAFGPYFAETIMAGECFKFLAGYIGTHEPRLPLHLSLWSLETAKSWHELHSGLPINGSLPPFYLVGCGAVGQAFLATLIASIISIQHATLIDHDAIDDELTNLNRYPLAIRTDEGTNKALLAQRFLAERGISSFAFPGKWEDYQSSVRDKQRADLLEQENQFKYEHLISCVDGNPARHALQRFWPRLLFGGSTLGLALTVQNYDMTSDFDCLMCANPITINDWSIELQADKLRNMSAEQRAGLANEVGADIDAVEDYLRTRRCGSLGEREMAKFRASGQQADWSVGFVSVAAGVTLSAVWVSRVLNADLLNRQGNAFRFSFETASGRITAHRRRVDCECAQQGKKIFEKKWRN